MHAQRLTTRIKLEAFQGEACLLVYDEQQLTETMLSDDVREIFDSRPGTARIYILAPFVAESVTRECICSGTALNRLSSYFNAIGGCLCLLSFFSSDGRITACEIPFFIDETGTVREGNAELVHDELRNGWLFDVFDKFRGRVDAPTGVHFAKSSRRHASKFLRVSNVLLSSSVCAVVAYFTLAALHCGQPRRIFVDTAPLLAVAFAMQRVAHVYNIWTMHSPVVSFSSYGGLDRLPPSSGRDLVLISASTSGGLVAQLVSKEFSADYIATLFFLRSTEPQFSTGTVVCDLSFRQGRMFGYPAIESYPASDCLLCRQGYFLAQLEGDQFQLEKRAIKQLTIKKISQTPDAREILELLAKRDLFRVLPFSTARRGLSSDFAVDVDIMLRKVIPLRQRFIRALRRHTPMPLTHVILVDFSDETFRALVDEAGLHDCFVGAKTISYDALYSCPQISPGVGGALVVFGTLSNFAKARDINAQLRIKVPKGCVAYISGLTVASSAEQLADLKMFLTYGELGRDTFTYQAAASLMLPSSSPGSSAWESELTLLQQINEDECIAEIDDRINSLLDSNRHVDGLLWRGCSGELTIQNDFVYLSVDGDGSNISQADVLATVANLLATVRLDNKGLNSQTQPGGQPIVWHQSVYGHVLLSPASFEDYNDAILHAAFLRLATPAELNYSNDEGASGRVLSVVKAVIQAWATGGGDSLPEFFVALATKRLSLASSHMDALKNIIPEAGLPRYLLAIADKL